MATSRRSPGRCAGWWLLVIGLLLGPWAVPVPRAGLPSAGARALGVQAAAQEAAGPGQELPDALAVSRAFKRVVRDVRPGVVHIRVAGGKAGEVSDEEIEEFLRRRFNERNGDEPPGDTEELRKQFRHWLERMEPPPGAGSGVLLDTEGYILTNNHVVAGRDQITVVLSDERELPARVVGTDPKTDLAVIKIDADNLHPLRMGNSDELEVGDWVLAVGSPFGLQQTVTHGIVSAKGRSQVPGVDIQYQDFIQTDAAVNPGNSGGPLVNLRGEVVGINTAIATRGDGYNSGIAFAIPSNMALKIARELKTAGSVTRGYLGIVPVAVEPADTEALGLPSSAGVLIDVVVRRSPADHAGLQVDDVIVAINDEPVTGLEQFRRLVAELRPDERARLRIIRDGQEQRVTVRIGVQPERLYATSRDDQRVGRELPRLGLTVRTLRPGLFGSRKLYDENTRGVIVVGRDEETGKPPNVAVREVVVGCNDHPVRSVKDLQEVLENTPPSRDLVLEILQPNGDGKLVRVKPDNSR